MKTLKNKKIIVTGAGSGIGRALTQRLVENGTTVVTVDLNESGLEETRDIALAKRTLGAKVLNYKLDVSKKEQWRGLRNFVVEEIGEIDGVINNAGISLDVPADKMTDQELERVMNINFYGVVYGVVEFLEILRTRPDALIANVASIFGVFSAPGYSAYNASKFAVRGYTDALRQDLFETNIQVNTIIPGHIGTNILHNQLVSESRKDEKPKGTLNRRFMDSFEEKGLAPLQAADVILRGIRKDDRYILVGKDAKIFNSLNRLAPGWFIDQYARVFRRTLVADAL